MLSTLSTAPRHEWRDQIQNIISETERNLGMKVRATPKPFTPSRPAAASYMSSYSHANSSVTAGASAPLPDTAGSSAAVHVAPQPEVTSVPVVGMVDGGRMAHQRLLEDVKFQLEMRGSLAEKQMQAVREEMMASQGATEKKWVEIARSVETSVEGRIEAEARLRALTEEKVTQLRDTASQAHQETVRMVSDMQQTAIDHSEVLRRLDADLSAFRVATETRYAEESQKVQRALDASQVRDTHRRVCPHCLWPCVSLVLSCAWRDLCR